MNQPVKVLVLSAGDGAGINFCNSLKLEGDRYHVIGTDTNMFRLEYATADERYLLPDPESDTYWESLTRLVQKTSPDFIYAADTNKELELLSARRAQLPGTIFLPPKAAVEVYENKWDTYKYFERAGLAVPETVLIERPSDVDEAVERFGRVWLRAIRGSGGKGSIPTDDPTMAKAWIDRHNGWGNFTAARVLTKKMATWIGLWHEGSLVVCQGRRRLHWEYGALSPSGVTGITGAQTTTSDSTLHHVALAAIGSIPFKPHGIVSVDMTYDENGIPNPTEIQASRFYSSIFFLARAGLNLPHLYVQLGLHGTLPALSRTEHPLEDDLLWLKAVDALPQLTTLSALQAKEQVYRI